MDILNYHDNGVPDTGCHTKEAESCGACGFGTSILNPHPRRVMYQEDITDLLHRISFLRQFYTSQTNCLCTARLNEYMGYECFKKGCSMLSVEINYLLKEAEKRGDIKC